jgi:hypothetical protein
MRETIVFLDQTAEAAIAEAGACPRVNPCGHASDRILHAFTDLRRRAPSEHRNTGAVRERPRTTASRRAQIAAVPLQVQPQWCRVWVARQRRGRGADAVEAYLALSGRAVHRWWFEWSGTLQRAQWAREADLRANLQASGLMVGSGGGWRVQAAVAGAGAQQPPAPRNQSRQAGPYSPWPLSTRGEGPGVRYSEGASVSSAAYAVAAALRVTFSPRAGSSFSWQGDGLSARFRAGLWFTPGWIRGGIRGRHAACCSARGSAANASGRGRVAPVPAARWVRRRPSRRGCGPGAGAESRGGGARPVRAKCAASDGMAHPSTLPAPRRRVSHHTRVARLARLGRSRRAGRSRRVGEPFGSVNRFRSARSV